MTEINLAFSEMYQAAQAGILRQFEAIKGNFTDNYGADKAGAWQMHIEGAFGECAVAKYLGLYWSGKGICKGTDIAHNIEVRTTSKQGHRLILHDEDKDEHFYWLVCGLNGSYSIKGFILGSVGKSKKYWTDPNTGRPAYFVPQADLNPPESWNYDHN